MTNTATTDHFAREDLVKILQALWGEEGYRPTGPRFYSNSSDSAGVMLWTDTGKEITQVVVEIRYCHQRKVCWVNMSVKGKHLSFSRPMTELTLEGFRALLPVVFDGIVKYGAVIEPGFEALVETVKGARGVVLNIDRSPSGESTQQPSGPRPVTKADVAAAKKTRRNKK